MTNPSNFNSELYYLGAVCKHNHVFSNTSHSLRQKSNRTCVECQKETKEKYKQANPILCAERTLRWRRNIAARIEINRPDKKRCTTCEIVKSKEDFHLTKYTADGLLGHCKNCDSAKQHNARMKRRKPRILLDPEIKRERKRVIRRRYKKTLKGKISSAKACHKRRVNLIQGRHKPYSYEELLSRFVEFENRCAYCGGIDNITIDHFQPLSKKGADILENIVPACMKCNSSKNDKEAEKWYKSKSFFSEERWQKLLSRVEVAFKLNLF